MTDVNDNPPKFDLPDYQAHNIDEDIPIGSSILRVRSNQAFSWIVQMKDTQHRDCFQYIRREKKYEL